MLFRSNTRTEVVSPSAPLSPDHRLQPLGVASIEKGPSSPPQTSGISLNLCRLLEAISRGDHYQAHLALSRMGVQFGHSTHPWPLPRLFRPHQNRLWKHVIMKDLLYFIKPQLLALLGPSYILLERITLYCLIISRSLSLTRLTHRTRRLSSIRISYRNSPRRFRLTSFLRHCLL